ncbi:MAG: hypothetical protein QNI92_03170 [Desulfobacterales bacterium]|nr:hypothetical protein [Desulfobacterales bacterium]
MIRRFVFFMAIGIWVFGIAQSGVAAEDKPMPLEHGFSGIKWGAVSATAGEISEVSQKPEVNFFIRPNEAYAIDDIILNQIIYGFFRDQFFAAYLEINSEREFDKIRDYITSRYGKPRAQLRVNQTAYVWSESKLKIKLKHFDETDRRKLSFYYKPLSKELNKIWADADIEITKPLAPKDKRINPVIRQLLEF